MPKLGLTMSEGKVLGWPIAIGAAVEKGQTVLVIESEKAEVEVEATASGVLRHTYVEPDPDALLPCGSLLGAITETLDDPFDADAFYKEHHRPEEVQPVAVSAPRAAPVSQGATAPGKTGRIAIAPAARALAKRLGLDLEGIPGTGPSGRITKEDVDAYAERRKALVEVAPGVSLEVPRQGEGRAVVLLPGFGTDVSVFARQVPVLAERFSVIGVNPRGVGLSDAPAAERYDVATAAVDAASLASEPVHVIGASLGAAVAMEWALKSPEKVRSLTLVTPFVEATPRLLAVLDLWCAAAESGGPALVAKAILPWLFGDETLGDPRARERVERGLAEIAGRVTPIALRRWAAGLAAWSDTRSDDLASIVAPTLIVAGGRDLLTPGAEALSQALPRAKCVVVSSAGHAVALEAADAVNEALLNHLTGV
jgi:pyruvate dehydrogenase E2 component (dihydrolipoamide acetyltransferase)